MINLPASGRRTIGRPQLRHKDVCKREMKVLDIDAESWVGLAADHTKRRSTLQRKHLETEKKLMNVAEDKHVHRNERCNYNGLELETTYRCDIYKQSEYFITLYMVCIFCISL